jgi:hypothetical protein
MPFMKTNHLLHAQSPSSEKRRFRWKWIILLITLAGVSLRMGQRTSAQPQAPPPNRPAPIFSRDEPITPERELARLAILEPAAFAAEIKKRQTREEIEAEQIAIFSLSQPRAYAAEFEKFKDNNRQQLEQQARAAILNPQAHSGRREDLIAEARQKKQRGEELDEFLKPKTGIGKIPFRPVTRQSSNQPKP